MTSTKYSKSAAARIIGKSRATIARHIKSGKLSCEVDESNNEVLDGAELYRVYKDDCKFDREEKRGQAPETKRSETEAAGSVAAMKAMQEQLTGQYVAQIDHLQLALEKAQDGQNRVTLLLEQRSTDTTAWQASLDAMSEKIANQTDKQISVLQERHDNELKKLKRALHIERNKSFWQNLFG